MHEERSPLRASRVGERLRSAREEIGMPLEEIAARTRVPMRHLVAIEEGDFASLPAAPYSAGFVRAYAGVLAASEPGASALRTGALESNGVDLGREFRVEVDRAAEKIARPEQRPFEPADPSRLPPRALAYLAAALALLLVIGYGVWRVAADGGSAADRARLAVGSDAIPATGTTTPSGAAVVLTALQPVWLRVYERSGATLFTGQLGQGRRLAVPAGAVDPLIRIARPEALRVTVGGRIVAAFGPPGRVVADVSLRPAALLAPPGAVASAFAPLATPRARALRHGRHH